VSTKIYEGKRFPKAKLAAFIRDVRHAQWQIIRDRARLIASQLKAERVEVDTWSHRVMATMDMFREIAKESFRRPWFDLECGWKIWIPEKGRFTFASPWGEHELRGNLVMPDYVEDYPYWDNTDPPEGMRDGAGYRRWRRRAKDWKCATEPSRDQDYVLLVVFEAKGIKIASLHVELDELGPLSAIDQLAAVVR